MELIERLAKRLFGSPILTNVVRGEVLEEICAMALEPEWSHVGGDYGSCDLIHEKSKLRIQVKQSAARQSWGVSISQPRFSIAHKTGEWVGPQWIEGRSRNAEMFIFGWHPCVDGTADHRDVSQWEFYVVAETQLPEQKSISLAGVKTIANSCSFEELPETVSEKMRLCRS